MLFTRKEKKYSVLFKNQIWSLDVGTFSIIWTKRELRKKLEKKWIYIQKIIDLDKIISYSKSLHWNDKELFNFTRYFRLELSKGVDNIVSPKEALKEVYKKTFNPLVYAILTEVEDNRKFENIIDDYPNIFDDIYNATIKWYFWTKHEPIDWLIKLEKYIQEKQEFKKNLMDKSRMYMVTISLVIVLSYILDWLIYDMIKDNFNTYWRPVPDFTENYHNILYFFVKYTWIFLILFGVLSLWYTLLQWDKIKIILWKIKLLIPFYWPIHKKKSVYDIIDTFVIMRESDIRMRDLLLILARSTNNYYYKKVLLEVREEVMTWKQLGSSIEEFWIFTWSDEDVVHAMKSSNIEEALISLRNVKKVELEYLTESVLRKFTVALVITTLFMWFSMGYAYYRPVQMQSNLVKEKIQADREASLENNN